MGFTRKQQKVFPLLSGSVVVVLITILGATGFFNRLDVHAWDTCTRVAGGWHHPDPRIVMVAVDQWSMDYFTANKVLWPWPRDMWARAIEVAEEAGAAGVLFDVLYDDPGIDRMNSHAQVSDSMFAERLSDDFPIVIASFLTPGVDSTKEIPDGLLPPDTSLSAYPFENHKLLLPYQPFRNTHLGLSNIITDDDGVLRATPLLFDFHSIKLPILPFQTAALVDASKLKSIKLDKDGKYWLRYYGHGGAGGVFPYISAANLITGRIPPDSLKGKILIIGGTAAGLLDFKPTPVGDVAHPYPGFEIHATLLSNILQGDGLLPVSPIIKFILTLLIGFIGLAAFRFFKGVLTQAIGIAAITVFMIGLLLLCYNSGSLLPLTSPLLACYLGVGTQLYTGWRLEGRQRARLHGLFSRYLDENVIESMLDKPDELQMIGVKRNATVLFTDMVGFTPMSEGLSPEEIVSVLNEYHRVVVDQILSNRGLLDKYVGDAVMAIFGAPLIDEEAQLHATKALLQIHEAVDKLTAERTAERLPTIGVCVGIHTDEVVVGNIGHPRRMDYTAIGSGVNTSSRLEGATRLLGSRNLVSETFCAGIPSDFHRRELGRVVLKGMHEPLRVYEMILDSDYGAWIDDWAEAWRLWHSGKRREAFDKWLKMKSPKREDKALTILLNRMEKIITSKGDDDDVLVFKSK